MSDYRIVQCFGVRRRPGKAAQDCRRVYRWTAAALAGHFGGKGVQACPYCGTMPDFRHPLNQYLSGRMTEEQARAAMPDYIEKLREEEKTI